MKKNTLRTMKGTGLILLLIGVCILLASQPVAAQSSNVVIIGGTTLDTGDPCGQGSNAANQMDWTDGGCLPVTGTDLAGITFTAMDPSAVSDVNLAPFDTAVLNVASYAMGCDTNILTSSQKADVIAFVNAGKKLIIFDSECYPGPVDYSWLPFPFTTNNPGATGSPGTLTIVEENTLSSNDPLSPYFIDANDLSINTDAVGDMNVMTTFDPNWCVDMSGTNYNNVTGPVHTYAKYPSGTDTGLIIYNGLDQDFQDYGIGNLNLRNIWVLELKQPFNPSGLPCGITVVGITLTPGTATNVVGSSHTVTATLTDLLGNPQPSILVTFTILSGPNAGGTGVCSPNADCTSDVNGQVNFTYTSNGNVGTDKIHACFTNQAGQVICSQEVTKDWTPPLNIPPDCTSAYADPSCLWPPNNKMVSVSILGVTDPDGDPVTITITGITSDEATATVKGAGGPIHAPDASGVGTDKANVRAERSGKRDGRVYVIHFSASDGKDGECDGSVTVKVPHDQSSKDCPAIDSGQNYDATQIN